MLCTSRRQEEKKLEGITGAQEVGRIPPRLQDGEEMGRRAILIGVQALHPTSRKPA